ncbi:MAG TPA: EamA family transporter [Thermoanaerobaculia bacterium]|nr:EamA family transporter [Thermoanaerobaculia bacterium]
MTMSDSDHQTPTELTTGSSSSPSLPLLVILALTGFAANSLLCRVALRQPGTIDPVSFTTIRLASGAMVLGMLAGVGGSRKTSRGNWLSAMALFAYAIAFSIAYLRLTAGTGALLLFGVVQLTMLTAGLLAGERPGVLQWLGVIVAFSGLVVLAWRGVSAPDPFAAMLMSIAGVSWGWYSLQGRGSRNPLSDTAGNFARSLPFTVAATLMSIPSARISLQGATLAIASGALASGIGYSLWYAALPRLTATRASILQLAVPLIAAAGGVLFLGEHPAPRLLIAAVAILAGVGLAIRRR